MTIEPLPMPPRMDGAGKPELAGDMLRGAGEIAAFLYGDPGQRRKVYHLAATTKFPCFRIGAQLHARRSVLMKWIADQESRGLRVAEDGRDRG